VCSRCGLELPGDQFSWRNSGRRRYSQCKSCSYKKVLEWRVANPDKYKALQARTRARIKADPTRHAHSREMENKLRRSKTRRGEHVEATCQRCGEAFAYEFIQRSRSLCELCRKHNADWKTFRLTGPEAHALRSRKRCDICGRTKDPGGRFNNWHIDHEKGTRNVRGLLCSYCNTVLGLMAHDPARLRAAADYLEA